MRSVGLSAMRLVRYFGGDVRSWMNLQCAYEVKVARVEALPRFKPMPALPLKVGA